MPSDIDSPSAARSRTKDGKRHAAVVRNKAAMAVDHYIFRVSNRIGLTIGSKTPLETERTLVRHFPAIFAQGTSLAHTPRPLRMHRPENPTARNAESGPFCLEWVKREKNEG